MTRWTIDFYANEYIEHHLAPDSWTITCDHDAEAERYALEKIAKRLGLPPRTGRLTLNSDTADVTDVLVDGEAIGEVHFIQEDLGNEDKHQ